MMLPTLCTYTVCAVFSRCVAHMNVFNDPYVFLNDVCTIPVLYLLPSPPHYTRGRYVVVAFQNVLFNVISIALLEVGSAISRQHARQQQQQQQHLPQQPPLQQQAVVLPTETTLHTEERKEEKSFDGDLTLTGATIDTTTGATATTRSSASATTNSTKSLACCPVFKAVVRGLVRSPIVISMVLGIAYTAIRPPLATDPVASKNLPPILDSMLEKGGSAFGMGSLFLGGIAVQGNMGVLKGKRVLWPTLISIIKVLVAPIIGYYIASTVYGDSVPIYAQFVFLYSALPTAGSTLIFARQYNAHADTVAGN